MNFELTEEQELIRNAARDFAQNEIAPIAAEFDHSGQFPEATIRQAGELGFMGIEVPEEYGGSGLDSLCYALVIEEISAADAAHGTIVSVNNSLYGVPLLEFGTDAQKTQFLKPVASGEVNGAYALTEPQSGSDAIAMRSRAVRSADGSYYTINAKEVLDHVGTGGQIHHPFRQNRSRRRRCQGHQHVRHRYGPRRIRAGENGTQAGHSRLGNLRNRPDDDYRCPTEQLIGEEGPRFSTGHESARYRPRWHCGPGR